MEEPPELHQARQHLAQAESNYRSVAGLHHLEAGLSLLDEVVSDGEPEVASLARSVASTYAARIHRLIRRLLDTDRGLPETELEHFFKLALAFDECSFELGADTRSTRVDLVRNLIDRYYEGHSPEAKQAALEKLSEITRLLEPNSDSDSRSA